MPCLLRLPRVGFRLRPGEAVTVVCVLVLSVAASWPALGPAIGFSDSADAASQGSANTTSAPSAPGYVPAAPTPTEGAYTVHQSL